MVIGVLETGEVRLYASLAAAMEEWGDYLSDLASDVIVLYDEDGTWLKPVETYGRKWYQLRPRLMSVELRRASEDEYHDSLGYLLKHEATTLASNPFVRSLEQLRQMYPWVEQ